MRIPKRVNAVLDRAEKHLGALVAVVALVAAAAAAIWIPLLAGFILGLAVGGFLVHLRRTRRMARLRAEIDDLLRQNGALRHRNNVLASGVITQEAQATQALPQILQDGLLKIEGDPGRTQSLPELPDDIDPSASPNDTLEEGERNAKGRGKGAPKGDPRGDSSG